MGAVFKLQASVIHRHLFSIIIMDTKILFGLLLAVVITSALPAAQINQDFTKISAIDESTSQQTSQQTTDKSTATTTTITATTSGSTTTNFSLTTLIVAVLMRNML